MVEWRERGVGVAGGDEGREHDRRGSDRNHDRGKDEDRGQGVRIEGEALGGNRRGAADDRFFNPD